MDQRGLVDGVLLINLFWSKVEQRRNEVVAAAAAGTVLNTQRKAAG